MACFSPVLENAIYFAPPALLLIVYHAFPTLAVAFPVAVVRYLLSTLVHYCTNLTPSRSFELRESYLLNCERSSRYWNIYLRTKPTLRDLYALGQAA
jgi:hypothetical protein